MEQSGQVDVQKLAYECSKKGICPQDAIWTLIANKSGDVQKHAADLKTEWKRREFLQINEELRSRLLAGEDPETALAAADAQRDIIGSGAEDKNQTRVAMCNSFLDHLLKAKKGELPTGYTTGLASLDRLTGGIGIPGRYRVWAARPGMGKSTMMQRAAEAAASAKCPTLVIMLEMLFNQAAEKYVQKRTGVSRSDLQQGKFTDDEYKGINAAIEELHDLPIYFEDATNDIGRIVGKIRQYVRKYGVKLVFIDYLQLVEDRSRNWGTSKHLEVEQISRNLAILCQTEQIDIIVLSQLSRAVETRGGDKRPQLSDLRHTGAIEQDAGQVLFFYCPDYYQILEDEEGQSLKGVVACIQAKDRYSGIRNTAFAVYRKRYDDYIDAGFGKVERSADDPPETPYNPNISPPPKADDSDDIPF